MRDLPAGVYRHYKNHLYLVLGYGQDSNQAGRQVVVYIGLELNGATPGPRLNIRTVTDFFAWVLPDGSPAEGDQADQEHERLGHIRRFTYVGPTWAPEKGIQHV